MSYGCRLGRRARLALGLALFEPRQVQGVEADAVHGAVLVRVSVRVRVRVRVGVGVGGGWVWVWVWV